MPAVADMLSKLLAEQTKSRLRRSNDNGLVETKNEAVIRKQSAVDTSPRRDDAAILIRL